MITLFDGTTTLELPEDLDWSDEFVWSATEQSMTRGLTGKPIIQVAARNAGRPITLVSPPDGGWMTRADLAAVAAWADIPGKEMTLTIHGVAHKVMFRHQDKPIESRPVMFFSDPAPEHFATVTFRFITLPE